MRSTSLSGLIALAGSIAGAAAQNTATSTSAVLAAAATALTRSPTSNVKGKAFDKVAIFWLENTDAKEAFANRRRPIPNLIISDDR
jgi:acid phosphatase